MPACEKDKGILRAAAELLEEVCPGAADLRGRREWMRFGDQLYLLPAGMPAFDGLKVLRPGLHVATVKKNRLEPAHACSGPQGGGGGPHLPSQRGGGCQIYKRGGHPDGRGEGMDAGVRGGILSGMGKAGRRTAEKSLSQGTAPPDRAGRAESGFCHAESGAGRAGSEPDTGRMDHIEGAAAESLQQALHIIGKGSFEMELLFCYGMRKERAWEWRAWRRIRV